MQVKRFNKSGISTLLVAIVVACVIVATLSAVIGAVYINIAAPSPSPSPSPLVSPTPTGAKLNVTIYGGEVSALKYGFGLTSNNITSPGTTLNFQVGDNVTVTFINGSTNMYHAFIVTDKAQTGATELFNAAVGSGSNPIPPGGSGTVTFIVNKAGTFYYICPVPGHGELGMWGKLIVSAAP